MTKILLAILLVASTFLVVAHGILVYQMEEAAFVMAEDETSDSKPKVHEGKEICKCKISFACEAGRYSFDEKQQKTALNRSFAPPEGVYDTPYNPPKAAPLSTISLTSCEG